MVTLNHIQSAMGRIRKNAERKSTFGTTNERIHTDFVDAIHICAAVEQYSFKLLPKSLPLILHFTQIAPQFRHFLFQPREALIAC